MERVLIILLFIAVISHNCEQVPTEKKKQASEGQQTSITGKLVCLGDGFTAGVGVLPEEAYPAVLEDLMASNGYNIKVVNAGIKGETVQMASERVEWILQQRLSAILFALGCQEMKLQRNPQEVQAAWSSLLAKVRRAYPEIPIFITTPCTKEGVYTGQDYYNSLIRQFNAQFIPLEINNTEEWWQPNSEYLNTKGQTAMAKQLLSAIESIITKRQ